MVTLSAQESARVGRGLAWSWCSRRNFSASHFFNRLDHSIERVWRANRVALLAEWKRRGREGLPWGARQFDGGVES